MLTANAAPAIEREADPTSAGGVSWTRVAKLAARPRSRAPRRSRGCNARCRSERARGQRGRAPQGDRRGSRRRAATEVLGGASRSAGLVALGQPLDLATAGAGDSGLMRV
jgi:hypothetical protein